MGSAKRFFLQECVWAVQGNPRSLILVPIESVCDFLLIRHSNLGLILHPFRDIAGFVLLTSPLLHPNLGVFPLHQIADVGVNPSWYLELLSREIIFESFQPM